MFYAGRGGRQVSAGSETFRKKLRQMQRAGESHSAQASLEARLGRQELLIQTLLTVLLEKGGCRERQRRDRYPSRPEQGETSEASAALGWATPHLCEG